MQERNSILVTGANGFIGRWLVTALLDRGYSVVAAMRQAETRAIEYTVWLQRHLQQPLDPQQLQICEFDLEQVPHLMQQAPMQDLIAIYHLAADFNWGLQQEHANRVNVGACEQLLEQAAQLPRLQRFVWIGGYRIAQQPEATPSQLYRALGGYEASKVIAHQRMKQQAAALGIAWTALHPAAVIGHSQTGETSQTLGMGEMVVQLQRGKLMALPGSTRAVVPLVHVDFVAEFAAGILEQPDSVNQEYLLLDDTTPTLTQLLHRIGVHLGARVPRLRLPLGLLKRMPACALPTSKETLSFIAEDRYDIANTRALARTMGIEKQLSINNLESWVDQVVRL